MHELIDPLDGIPLDGTRIIEAGTDHPDHAIRQGDRLIVRPATEVPDGSLIIADLGGHYTIWKHDRTLNVHAIVLGVVRKVAGDES